MSETRIQRIKRFIRKIRNRIIQFFAYKVYIKPGDSIQEAIDSVPKYRKGIVFLARGDWNVRDGKEGDGIKVPSNISLVGKGGLNKTILNI